MDLALCEAGKGERGRRTGGATVDAGPILGLLLELLPGLEVAPILLALELRLVRRVFVQHVRYALLDCVYPILVPRVRVRVRVSAFITLAWCVGWGGRTIISLGLSATNWN